MSRAQAESTCLAVDRRWTKRCIPSPRHTRASPFPSFPSREPGVHPPGQAPTAQLLLPLGCQPLGPTASAEAAACSGPAAESRPCLSLVLCSRWPETGLAAPEVRLDLPEGLLAPTWATARVFPRGETRRYTADCLHESQINLLYTKHIVFLDFYTSPTSVFSAF